MTKSMEHKYDGYIIFSDMDATLLNDEKQISHTLRERIYDFTAQGGRFVLSSGRPLDSIIETRDKIGLEGLDGSYIIAYNGALIYDCGAKKGLMDTRVPFDLIKPVMDMAKARGIHAQTYTEDSIVCEKDSYELAFYRRNIHLPAIITDDVVGALSVPPYKLLLIHPEEETDMALHEFVVPFEAAFGHTLHCFFSHVNYLEVCHKEASKGNAVGFLCDYLGIPLSNAYAAGDTSNDISMLQAAGIGVCMCNGTEDTKAVADVITKKDNNQDGILEIFEMIDAQIG